MRSRSAATTRSPRPASKKTSESARSNKSPKSPAVSAQKPQTPRARTPRTPRTPRSLSAAQTRGSLVPPMNESDMLLPVVPPLEPESNHAHDSWRSEWQSIALLVALYTLQGVPLGLVMGSLPLLLQSSFQSSTSAYAMLAMFGISGYPYSLKLLWSPFVDSFYVPSFGRRKSWIVPIQFLIGAYLIVLSSRVEMWITESNMHTMTASFFALVVLVATQDIAVDGWAVEMLKNQNFASTSQSIGLNIGYFLSYTIFLGLNSAEFCNKWLRCEASPDAMVSLAGYMYFWGIMFFLVTISLILFKTEAQKASEDVPPSIQSVYRQIISVLRLPNMQSLILMLLTARIGFAAGDNITVLKLTEKGLKKEVLGLFVLIGFPFELLAPVLAAKLMNPREPLSLWYRVFPLRLITAFLAAFVVHFMPTSELSLLDYALILTFQLSYQFIQNIMFVSLSAYCVQITDTRISATYMTLLNTLANLGHMWLRSASLVVLDYLTIKESCAEEKCPVIIDGYYVLSLFCIVFGAVYYKFELSKIIRHLQRTPKNEWLCPM